MFLLNRWQCVYQQLVTHVSLFTLAAALATQVVAARESIALP